MAEAHRTRHHEVTAHEVSPFMARVRGALVDERPGAAPLAVAAAARSVADATDAWVELRALAEQVVSEANAVLHEAGDPRVVELDDEIGGPGLGFTVRAGGRWFAVRMVVDGSTARLALDGPAVAGGVEPAAPEVLEDLVLQVLFHRNG